MKISIKRDVLNKALNDVSKAVSTKIVHPILAGIKIETVKNGLSLKASDTDLSIETVIPFEENEAVLVEVETKGSTVVPAKLFGEIIRKLPMDDVTLEVLENNLTMIKSGKSEFKLIGWNPKEFPIFPKIDETNSVNLTAKSLKEAIGATIFAAADNESRPILTGVNWQLIDGALVCTATDSHRLSKRNVVITSTTATELNAVVPKKSLNDISKLVGDDAESEVTIAFSPQQAVFKFENTVVFSRLLEGTYPDTSRLIPTDATTTVAINKRQLLDAIDRAGLLASNSNNNVVRLSSLEVGAIEIQTSSAEIGNVQEEVEITSLTGDAIKIAFSGKYMKDALRALTGDEITLYFGGAMRPFLIKPTDESLALQLILPVRTA